jgi:hypothetical protein
VPTPMGQPPLVSALLQPAATAMATMVAPAPTPGPTMASLGGA